MVKNIWKTKTGKTVYKEGTRNSKDGRDNRCRKKTAQMACIERGFGTMWDNRVAEQHTNAYCSYITHVEHGKAWLPVQLAS